MTEKAVFEIEFNQDKFIKSVNEAISSTDKLDESLKEVTKEAKGVSFSKPISEINKLETAIKESQAGIKAGGKVLVDQMNNSAKAITDNEKAYRSMLTELKKQLKNVTDQDEFKKLRETISKTENALNDLTGATSKTEGSQKSARARMREMKQALIEMEDAGLDDTEMFRKMTIESAKLTDQMGDQAETIRVLSSDTYKLDAGVDTIKQLANVWSIAEGSLALFGVENEDVQKSIQKMIAIQTVANGIQELSTFLTGQSAGMIALKSGYNRTLAITEGLVATATGASTAATQAFSKALVATGIGAFVVGLGLLVAYWDDISDAISGATETSRTYEEAQKGVTESVKDFNLDLISVKNSMKAAKEGTMSKKEALKQYNDTLGESIGYANSLEQAEMLMAKNTSIVIESLKLKTQAQIFYTKAAEESAKVVSGVAAETSFLQDAQALALTGLFGVGQGIVQNAKSQLKNIEETNAKAKIFNKEGDRLTKEAIENDKKLAKGSVKPSDKKETKKAIENIYKELRDGFNADLKAINTAELTGMDKINAQAEKNYQDRIEKINKALSEGKLTKLQAKDLRSRVGLIQKTELEKETKKFIEERDKALLESANESKAVQDELTKLEIDNLQESYAKQIETIKYEESMRLKAVQEARYQAEEKIKSLNKLGFITSDEANKLIIENESRYNQISIENRIATNKKLQEANLQRLSDLQTSLQTELDLQNAKVDLELSNEIASQTKLLNEGKISRETYNSEIGKLEKQYQDRKDANRVKELDKEIKNIDAQIEVAIDGEKKKQLLTEKFRLETEKNNLQNKDENPIQLNAFERLFGDTDKAKETAKATIDLAKEVFATTAKLMQEQARMEVEAYDRAIKLQQDRVTEAQKIADAGNSEYLQAETDRLNELEAKREASARRELEIAQAIQAAQILVAVAGAAAQIAKPGATAADVIAGIAVVVGALGSGISLVRQSQGSSPKFYDGTDYLERGNNPKGRDTIPVMAHEGERIVPSYINSKLKGIKNSDLPKLVDGSLFDYNFVNVKDSAMPKSDTSVMEKRLSNLEALQAENNEYLKKLSINVTMDSDGFATSISTMMDNKRKTNNA
jgi:hypothetical protein